MNPRISVIMPVWNGEKYLAAAVESILAQTFGDFELIIVDDGSTDSTPDIIASYRDPRLRVVKLDHAGIVSALNAGVAQARAAWIARQDADDISKPTRFEKQWEAVSLNKDVVLSHTDVELIGEIGDARRPWFPKTKAFLALKLCFQCPVVHSTVLFNKEAFIKAGGYRPEERHAEDYALWGRMIELGGVAGIPEKLLSLRMHSVSVSRQNLETQVALSKKISIEHCHRFMGLGPAEAERALAVLGVLPARRSWKEWNWFLMHCAPRLRWKNGEVLGWLALHTIRKLAG
jgi:glycosyltransferase involved in cell wall biosynthesis